MILPWICQERLRDHSGRFLLPNMSQTSSEPYLRFVSYKPHHDWVCPRGSALPDLRRHGEEEVYLCPGRDESSTFMRGLGTQQMLTFAVQ